MRTETVGIYMFLLIAVVFVTASGHPGPVTCLWELKLATGSDELASTNATISMIVDDVYSGGRGWEYEDLNRKLMMDSYDEEGYTPFRRSQVDTVRIYDGPCQASCKITLKNNGGYRTDPAWQLAKVALKVHFTAGGILVDDRSADVNEWVMENTDTTVDLCK